LKNKRSAQHTYKKFDATQRARDGLIFIKIFSTKKEKIRSSRRTCNAQPGSFTFCSEMGGLIGTDIQDKLYPFTNTIGSPFFRGVGGSFKFLWVNMP
jgi:hypothetical protein